MMTEVFPAYAGMSPFFKTFEVATLGFPRLRGDEPANMAAIVAP